MDIDICCGPYGYILFAEKFKAKINTNIFRCKTYIFYLVYLS